MAAKPRLQVMYTVDVEAWPRMPNWRSDAMAGDLARDIYGATPEGDFGISYQVELLRKHGLKGVFFVEALMACELGTESLARIVDVVQSAGSEIQLHIHTEWFEKMSAPLLATRAYNIRELCLEDQKLVIERALENLQRAGAENVIAYRAGNFGADFQTLRALRACGIRFDSSYNYCYLDKGCGLDLGTMLVQPEEIEGVLAHELAHVKNRDILTSSIAATIAAAITFLARMAFFFPMGSSSDDDEGTNPIAAIAMLILAFSSSPPVTELRRGVGYAIVASVLAQGFSAARAASSRSRSSCSGSVVLQPRSCPSLPLPW